MIRPIAVVAIIALFLSACTKPYIPPKAEEPGSFDGVTQILAKSPNKRVRMAFTHGMCSENHDLNWAERRAASIAEALSASDYQLKPIKTYYDDQNFAAVTRYDALMTVPGGEVDATFLIWGRSMDRYREDLEYDNYREGDEQDVSGNLNSPRRASLNMILKRELMNRCFIDAVVYGGQNGDRVRASMRQAACEWLGGTTGNRPPSGRPDQGVTCTPVARRQSEDPVVLVPESLGSIIMMDAFVALNNGKGNFVENQLSQIEAIFLATNQIPLLSLASTPVTQEGERMSRNQGAPAPSALAQVLEIAASPRQNRRSVPIQVVGITDPNDPLSYRIRPKHLSHTGSTNGFTVNNILVSNATTYFGLLSNPLKAHYETEGQHVFDIIANGSAALAN